jgi:hypothetical protein
MGGAVRGEVVKNPTVAATRGPTVIHVDGVFDVPAARLVARTLADLSAMEVRIDMTRVREFHDYGVALLANAIASRRPPTTVLGLHEHHLRLLRYLAIDTGAANLSAGIEIA